jgi:UDP-N-acetylmuramyl pentapeptide phosphotransferase/UDP-N-acetylglucosamine-1-phosphate transferase
MLIYISIILLLIAVILVYFRIADRFNIIDKPNKRSSHSHVTIRGGGIIFPLAALLWFFLWGFHETIAIGGLILIAVISFVDDLNPISGLLRITVHIIAASLLFYETGIFTLPWYFIALAYIAIVGWINAFNFMDGINAITPFYSFIALGTFFFMNRELNFARENLITILIIAVLIFSFFNARKRAKTFAGDVGSVSLAFILAWLMVLLMLRTGNPAYIMFFVVYGIDSIYTIIHRLIRKENIFVAHRFHLYQLLANELNWPHVLVAAVYALIQLLLNIAIITLNNHGLLTLQVFASILVIFSAAYILLRINILIRIRRS